jgi:hypothetical protein
MQARTQRMRFVFAVTVVLVLVLAGMARASDGDPLILGD